MFPFSTELLGQLSASSLGCKSPLYFSIASSPYGPRGHATIQSTWDRLPLDPSFGSQWLALLVNARRAQAQSFSVQEGTRSTTSSSRLRGFGAPGPVSCCYLTYPAKESVWCALFDGC